MTKRISTDEAPIPLVIDGLPEIEIVCDACQGSGDADDWVPEPNCQWCNGSGLKLTEFGESLIEFVRRHT